MCGRARLACVARNAIAMIDQDTKDTPISVDEIHFLVDIRG